MGSSTRICPCYSKPSRLRVDLSVFSFAFGEFRFDFTSMCLSCIFRAGLTHLRNLLSLLYFLSSLDRILCILIGCLVNDVTRLTFTNVNSASILAASRFLDFRCIPHSFNSASSVPLCIFRFRLDVVSAWESFLRMGKLSCLRSCRSFSESVPQVYTTGFLSFLFPLWSLVRHFEVRDSATLTSRSLFSATR